MNLEAEHRLIVTLLSGPEDALPTLVDVVDREDFAAVRYGHIFGVAKELWHANAPINEVTIAERTGMTVAFISDLTSGPEGWEPPSRAAYYASIVQKEAFNRRFASGVADLAKLGEELSPAEKQVRLDALSSSLHEKTSGRERADSASCIREVRQAMGAFRQDVSIRTGIDSLDRLVPCGYQPGHFWVLGGYTSTGKTTLACQLAGEVIRQGGGVVFFSLEMTREEIARRMIAYEADCGSTQLLRGQVGGVLVEPIMKKLEGLPLWIYETVFNTPSMVSQVKKRQHEKSISLVIVDYVQLLRSGGSLFERMAKAAGELKEQAKALGVSILALSQVNHQSQQTPNNNLIEYKGGGDLAASSEVALMLVPESGRDLTLQVRKNKHGQVGKIKLHYRENYSGMVER